MAHLKLAVVAGALTEDPREAPKLARVAGFAGLQFDAFASRLRIPDLTQSGRREFLHLITTQDRQLVGLRADLGPKGFGIGADVDRLLSQLDKTLEAAAGLAAPLLCLNVGPLPEPPKVAKPKPKITPGLAGLLILPERATAPEPEAPAGPPPDPKLVAQIDAAMTELAVLTDRYNVIVAFRSDMTSFAAIEDVLRRARCQWFGVDLDPTAVLQDEWPMDEVLSRLGPEIRHIRGRDATAGSDRRTKPAAVGRGDVAWPALLADLDAAGYGGWVTIDPLELPDRRAAAVAGEEYLRGLLG